MFLCIESIEMVVRKYLCTDTLQTTPDHSQICTKVQDEVLQSETVLLYWEEIVADSIPTKYELYSIELLKQISELWIRIRGHAFAKEWTMKFESKYKKGTRKTSKPI